VLKRREEIRTPLRFVVTVDTEADSAWSKPEIVALENLRSLPRFQDLCEEYGIVPSYLLTYECATRDEALAVLEPLASRRRCEIGHHLHVWTTPPFQSEGPSGIDGAWIHAFQFELPDSLFTEKAERLRQAIEAAFGRSPTAHRAGRWGVDQRTVDWLASAGFVVETSMRTWMRLTRHGPGIKLSTPRGKRIAAAEYEPRRNPYFWPSAIRGADVAPIVELPATVEVPDGLPTTLCRRAMALRWPGESIFARLYRRGGGQRMLRPDPSYAAGELPKIMERALGQGVTVLNLMLHSSELALGTSPFTQTGAGLNAIWTHLEAAFRYVRDRGLRSEGISDVGRLALQCAKAA
jgi:hypothetical protein